ncbi:hypothetical protein KR222_000799 [Zaprionus bogoriensis]|nr:hypothetical protein KR222_000799 [Zaprionus bogoriensis]
MYLQVFAILLLSTFSALGWDNNVLSLSQDLKQLLDPSYLPCDNFYSYVCSRSANFNQTQRSQQEQQRFQQMLAATRAGDLLEVEQQLVNFYRSCEAGRDVQALRKSQLYSSTGGWPALEAGGTSSRDWLQVLANFHDIGAAYFFDTHISMQSNKRVVTLQPDATRRHTLRKFEQRMTELFQRFGIKQSRVHVTQLEVLSLERARRGILKTDRVEDQVQFSYASFKRNAFSNTTLSRLDWDKYFKHMLGGKSLRATDMIVVKQLPRLVDYLLLLQNTSMLRLLNWMWTDYLMDIFAGDCQQLVESYAGDVYAHLVLRVSGDRVGLTQMYSAVGDAYKKQLGGSVWVDEISQQASQRFLGQLMHLTLNGDERLSAAYHELQLDRNSFYENLEKLRHFQHKHHVEAAATQQQLRQFAQAFDDINGLLPKLNVSTPITFLLFGEPFARALIAAGSSSRTTGAWRSMDSEPRFAEFSNCSDRLLANSPAMLSADELLLSQLGQRLAWSSYRQWLGQQSAASLHLPHSRPYLTAKKLYFIGSLLRECRAVLSSGQQERQRQLQHAVLRNTPEFSEAFECEPGDALYATQQRCRLNTS